MDSSEKRLETSLKFEHRIEDTRSVKTVELRDSRPLGKRPDRYVFMLVAGLDMVVLIIFLGGRLGMRSTFAYDLQTGDGKVVRVTARALRDSVKVESLDGKFKATMGAQEFSSRCTNHPVVIENPSEATFFLVGSTFLYIVVPSAVLGFRLREHLANKRLRRLLALDEAGDTQGAA
jgi:hypothetical protein